MLILKFLTKLKALILGKYVGFDDYGNKYFELKSSDAFGRKKRVCIYSGVVEATKIPSEWHSWMHYKSDAPNIEKKHFWQVMHLPSLTGTKFRFTNTNPNSEVKKEYSQTPSRYSAWRP
jgi:NADH:ubiquinone oxidoreductase subunit